MKRPDLTRYDRATLDRMLYSYRTLAREHLEAGHYALAKWATRMQTWVVIELGLRDHEDEALRDSQLTIDDDAPRAVTFHPGGWTSAPADDPAA